MDPQQQPALSQRGSIRIAECWADLTRSLTLYPETNSRVLRSLASFLEVLLERLEGVDRVEIGFSSEAVWVGDDAFKYSPTSNLAWLKERLEKGGLSGAVFGKTVDEESLIGFTKRLLELFTRRDMGLSFEELWPRRFPGIALLEKRFDGAFSDRRDEEEGIARPSIAGRSRRMEETLSNALTKDERVRSKMDEIQERIKRAAAEDEELGSIDLLGSIVDLLPEEALNNYQTAVDLTLKVLGTVEDQIAKGKTLGDMPMLPDGSAVSDDSTFQRLLFAISRTHFNRIDPGKRPDRVKLPEDEHTEEAAEEGEAEEAKDGQGGEGRDGRSTIVRAGDEKFDDSLPALLRELEELAPLETSLLRTEDLEDLGEQLGVYLHYLVRLEKPNKVSALQTGLTRLLQDPDNESVGVLREYLEPLTEGRQGDLHLSRVAMWLRRHGRRDLLKRCGVLTADWVCREFPEEFLVYVQTLDLADELDVVELGKVCERIGRDRFLAAKDLFTGATEFLDGDLAKKLFLLDKPSLTPFLRQVFDKRRRYFKSEFALYLQKNVAKSLDQKILELVDGSKYLRSAYLYAIADDEVDKLSEQRLAILYAYIVATDQDLSRVKKRERAIKLLANFDRPHVRSLLERLVSDRKFLVIPVQPHRIRKAAAGVLRSYRGKGSK